jgi:hypothetical protein
MIQGEETTPLHIPKSLYKRLERNLEGTGFPSVSSYATHILRRHILKMEEGEKPITDEEEEKIKERLRALGYLD